MTGLTHLTMHELGAAYRRGVTTPAEVVRAYLDRIDAVDGRVGAYLTVTRDEAMAAAKESEARFRAGAPASPLDGIPIALKDVLSTRGVRTTCGSRILESYVPPYDATAVARLRDPRQADEAQAREVARATPAVAWMSFANDGNESAAFETGIQLAYHLAAGSDEATLKVLKEVVTMVYPSHNPESHSRHVAWMKASATGNPDPAAQEHRGDWRMDTNNNHYQIDLNRDAAFLSQLESRVAVREIHRWNPVVYIDHHGNPDRFFFPPWALPVNAQMDGESESAPQRRSE